MSPPKRQPSTMRMLRPRLGHDAEIGPRRLPALRILFLGVLVGHRAGDDDFLAVLPVYRCSDLVRRKGVTTIGDDVANPLQIQLACPPPLSPPDISQSGKGPCFGNRNGSSEPYALPELLRRGQFGVQTSYRRYF